MATCSALSLTADAQKGQSRPSPSHLFPVSLSVCVLLENEYLSKLSLYHITSFIFKTMIPKHKQTSSFNGHLQKERSFPILEPNEATLHLLRTVVIVHPGI